MFCVWKKNDTGYGRMLDTESKAKTTSCACGGGGAGGTMRRVSYMSPVSC